VQRLGELGWNEGHSIAIEYRWAEGRSERYSQIAAEFVRRKVDVIVTVGSAVAAAKQATSVIPIVFAIANDPLSTGLVASLSRPGGNVTGLSVQSPELAGKRVELLREVIPGLRRLAIMGNAGYPAAVLEMNGMEGAARTLSLDVTRLEIQRAEDIWPAIAALNGSAGALYVCADSLISANHTHQRLCARGTIADVALYAGSRRARRFDVLWTELFRLVPTRRRFRRQDSARR
jgi:ABC-type uncharacterized transport system substrate-binding protein